MSSVLAMVPANRTRIDTEVDAAHLAQAMRRFDVSEADEAVALALELAAASSRTGTPTDRREAETVEELVSLESLHRLASP